MKRLLVLHPVLFGIYPVLALLAANLSEVRLEVLFRPLAVCAVFSLVLLLLVRLVIRNWNKAALVTSFALFLFYSYGSIYDALRPVSIGGITFAHNKILYPLAGVLLLIWIFWLLRKVKHTIQFEVFFGLVGVISVLFPLYSIISYNIRPVEKIANPISSPNQLVNPQNGKQPNIYYIIVDAYARQDVLSSFYNYDNGEFINFLKGQGFYVANDSHSNYPVTALSLSSSLNMEYLDQVAQTLGTSSTDERPLTDLIAHSQVRADLKSLGYQMIAFPTGWDSTSVTDADRYMMPSEYDEKLQDYDLDGFEVLLLRSTMLRAITEMNLLPYPDSEVYSSPLTAPYAEHRERILYTLSELKKIPDLNGSFFVFAHMIIPHPPFVFGPNGEELIPSGGYTLQDGEGFPGTSQEYIKGYRDQVAYIDKMLESTITHIIKNSQTPPIIILQGDHGPRSNFQYNSPEKTNMYEAFSNLNAYYFPGLKDSTLYPSITPVNSFRLLFNLYFGGHFDLLKDESYFSTLARPFDFIKITGRTRSDQSAPSTP